MNMKYLLSVSCTVIVITILLSVIPVNGEEEVYENMIRLHVIANSDSEEDQQIKLDVRDKIIESFSDELGSAGSFESAYGTVCELKSEIENVANEVLTEKGVADRAKVEIGEEIYPERVYDVYTLPAGEYVSLRVVIGEGAGKNWWCVLFPPLCTSAASKEDEDDEKVFIEAGISTEGYKMIKRDKETKYKVRFRVLELFSGIFGYEY